MTPRLKQSAGYPGDLARLQLVEGILRQLLSPDRSLIEVGIDATQHGTEQAVGDDDGPLGDGRILQPLVCPALNALEALGTRRLSSHHDFPWRPLRLGGWLSFPPDRRKGDACAESGGASLQSGITSMEIVQ